VLAIALDAGLVVADLARPWRLAVLFPIAIAVYGFLQAFGKT
jgi:hypothetical protein